MRFDQMNSTDETPIHKDDAATTITTNNCCQPFDPALYRDSVQGTDYKILTWKKKPFVKEGAYCCYYVPIKFDKAVIRAFEKISKTPFVALPDEEVMIISDYPSPWYTNVYVSVANEQVEGAIVETISGVFLAKVYEGQYSKMGDWIKEMEKLIPQVRNFLQSTASNDGSSKVNDTKMYFYYPTCPKCAKKFGKCYVVLLAKLSDA